jgi:hypothetical protein
LTILIIAGVTNIEVVDRNKQKRHIFCFTVLVEAVTSYSDCSKWLPSSLWQVPALFKTELVSLHRYRFRDTGTEDCEVSFRWCEFVVSTLN